MGEVVGQGHVCRSERATRCKTCCNGVSGDAQTMQPLDVKWPTRVVMRSMSCAVHDPA